jgi:Zn-dependent protease with chaperone function
MVCQDKNQMSAFIKTTTYRYPHEYLVLATTFLLVLIVIAITVTATVCLSGVFLIGFVVLSFLLTRSHHQSLMRSARRITPETMPALARLTQAGIDRLQPGDVHVYMLHSRSMNAYTFGLTSPKIVVLYSSLFKVMDPDELMFILGHELGHVALGHTWLNSLVGGVAGIPSSWSAGAIMTMAFLWWNRTCEYSADRAGMLACGKPEKAVTALIKLAAGPKVSTQADLERALRSIDAEDDTFWGNVSETLATHPMIIRRIEAIREYAASAEYKRLLALVEGNTRRGRERA